MKKKEKQPTEMPPEEIPEEPVTEAEAAEEAEPTEEVPVQSEADALKAALEEAKKQAQEHLESWQRERADFSNYRKRVERDQNTAAQNYKADALKKFLVILDDLSLAYQHRPQEGEAAAWAEGIELILRKFNSVLENEGMEMLDVKPGSEFNPNCHLAVSMEESETFESGQVIEVLQNGYRMGERIIRPAMVRVAQ